MEGMLKAMIDEIFQGGFFQNVADILTKSPTEYSTAWNFISLVYSNYILPIGYSLMVIYFLCAVIEKSSIEGFSVEQFFRLLIKLFVAKMIMDNGLTLIKLMMNLGAQLVASLVASQSINSAVTDLADHVKALAAEETNGWGFFECIPFLLKLFIPWLCTLIIQIVVKFICYSRLIEIMARASLAPIAMSDIIHGGLNSTGYRYLKSFLAVCLQGVVIFVIAYVFTTISGDLLTADETGNFFDFVIAYLTTGFAALALIVRSLGFAKEMVGAN